MKRRRGRKDGAKQVSEKTRERGGDGEMGMEVKSTFEATAYLALGFDKTWQSEVLRRGV